MAKYSFLKSLRTHLATLPALLPPQKKREPRGFVTPKDVQPHKLPSRSLCGTFCLGSPQKCVTQIYGALYGGAVFLLSLNFQKRLEYKENTTKYRSLS